MLPLWCTPEGSQMTTTSTDLAAMADPEGTAPPDNIDGGT